MSPSFFYVPCFLTCNFLFAALIRTIGYTIEFIGIMVPIVHNIKLNENLGRYINVI